MRHKRGEFELPTIDDTSPNPPFVSRAHAICTDAIGQFEWLVNQSRHSVVITTSCALSQTTLVILLLSATQAIQLTKNSNYIHTQFIISSIMPLSNMIPASVGRANSRRTRRPSQRRASSRYSAMECSQDFSKSVDFDISVDFGKSADLGRSNNEFNCSQDFHRSQEFGRDRTLSTQGSSSEDDRDLCDTETGPNSRRRKVQSSSRSRQTSSNDVRDACPVTGHHSNILADYYIFPTVLGKGHYGCVRECMHRKTKQFYAVKSIEKQKIGRLDHLQREVYLLSKINHKGIMKMVDIFEDVEFVHIVTEKYVGGELFDRIIDYTTEQGCFDEIAAGTIVKSLLESVAYLHRNGIVHRDIKPENVLFISEDEEDLTVKLIDFGLARRHKKGDALMSNPVGTGKSLIIVLITDRSVTLLQHSQYFSLQLTT